MTVVSLIDAPAERLVHTTWCTDHDDMGCNTSREVRRVDNEHVPTYRLEAFTAGDGCPMFFYVGGKPFDRRGAEALRDRLDELLRITYA